LSSLLRRIISTISNLKQTRPDGKLTTMARNQNFTLMCKIQEQRGFTLLEMLLVVILLGIMAMIIVPQISVSTSDARLNTLRTNLKIMRTAIECYYFQHNSTYPGEHRINGNPTPDAAQATNAFVAQLTQYTDINGDCQESQDVAHIFGPYIKGTGLPTNPCNNRNDVICDVVTMDITERASDGSTGWKFYTQTGVLMPNDGAHDTL